MKFPPGTGGLISRHQKYSGREVTRGKEGKEKGGKEGGGGEASLNREKQSHLSSSGLHQDFWSQLVTQ